MRSSYRPAPKPIHSSADFLKKSAPSKSLNTITEIGGTH
jgi:hypothetical protein